MSRSMLIVFAVLFIGFGVIAGCGRKGPLYMPDHQNQPQNQSN